MQGQQQYLFAVHNAERNITYFAIRELGRGGQGGVWAGHDSSGCPVALKIVWPTTNDSHAYWAWYNDQHAHLQCFDQPHVVRSYDQFRSQEGWYVIVMEQAVRSLDDVINTGIQQTPVRVCSIGAQVLHALANLHSLNMIHRDVSAKNLLEFPDGVVKLNDFGIAKANIAPGEATGTQLGNAVYLPPELLNAGRWTHQSDIYQLGLVLISLLLGRHVIPPNIAIEEMAKRIRNGVPRQAAERLANMHGQLGHILTYMVCRTANMRYPNAATAGRAISEEYKRQRALEQVQRDQFLKALGVGAAGIALLTLLAKG